MSEANEVFSAAELLMQQLGGERPSIEHLNPIIFPDGGPRPESLIEISGAPNSGKSLLLWQLMARCLPSTYFGGKYCDIIFVNLSHKFDLQQFSELLQQVIHESGKTIEPGQLQESIQKCMDSVICLDCYTLEEYDLVYDVIEETLLHNGNVALIAVDTLCEFYWLEAEHKRLRMYTHYAKCVQRLKSLCQEHSICCAYTICSQFVTPKAFAIKSLSAVTIDYKLKLELLPNGNRYLNGIPITIDKGGIHFVK